MGYPAVHSPVPTDLMPGKADFDAWIGTPETPADIKKIADPLQRIALVMALLTQVQAAVLDIQKDNVTAVTDRMAKINELMKTWNAALAQFKNDPNATANSLVIEFTGSKAEVDAIYAALNMEGIDVAQLVHRDELPDGRSQISSFKSRAEDLLDALQKSVDTLSTSTSSAQLSLQTMVGRYNSTFEMVIATLKKALDMAQSTFRG